MVCGEKNTSKLEKFQERALRLVFCDQNSSYGELLKRGNFLCQSLSHSMSGSGSLQVRPCIWSNIPKSSIYWTFPLVQPIEVWLPPTNGASIVFSEIL